jgi:hypothetical protein
MPMAPHDLEAFLTQYRAFLQDLMGAIGADTSPRRWLQLLVEQPFSFPAGLPVNPDTIALQGRLIDLAVKASHDDRYELAASAEIRRILAANDNNNDEEDGEGEDALLGDVIRSPMRGRMRGPAREPTIGTPWYRHRSMAEPPEPTASFPDEGAGDRSSDEKSAASAATAPDDGLLSTDPTIPRDNRSLPGDPTVDPLYPAPPASAVTRGQAAIQPSMPAPVIPAPRYMNAAIRDHDRDEPLVVDEMYVLQFNVDLEKGGESGNDFSARIPDVDVLLRPDEDSVELTIQLDGDAFDIPVRAQPLQVPRTGPSLRKASFPITPKREGRATLTATVHKAGNFLFEMELSYSIGVVNASPATTAIHGRALSAANTIMPRELGFRIKPVESGYECTVWGEVNNQVTLPITAVELTDMVARARNAMMDVVLYANSDNIKIFQQSVVIDDVSRDAALKTLAFAGAELFQRLFYGPSAGPEVNLVGDWLRTRATKPGRVLKLQIVAERFPIPWGLLYMGDTADAAPLDWQYFLGMKHIIEQIPRQANMLVDDYVIPSDAPSLAISVTVNTGIDAQMKQIKRNLVASQVDYWTARAASAKGDVQLQQRTTKTDLLKALHSQSAEQVMYLYCHAITSGLNDPGGIMASSLVLSGDERVTLSELNREAPMRMSLPGNPLVFLNACESAELTPEFYDGFVPYFMAKGARGVVGTECKTPALFATAWAQEFFPRFLAGQPLGVLFRDLRNEFCLKHGNPLGLLYAVYCDGDTKIQPGLSS